ncbi:heterokaryon incompatibility protein-domain-containing protein, partial [Bisporella sp. PMI_857]
QMYRYRKLKNPETDLRLVQILPGTDGDPLNCLICTRSARRIKRYYALSYAWGDATQRVPILLNGRKIYITINLFTALVNLRTPKKAKICLWIDALCIDQENIHERDQQVLRMRSIYAMAYRVIV